MTDNVTFKAWPKIPRNILGKCIITEKIDGTNACVIIEGGRIIGVQSRKRMITPEDDNYGFAEYVHSNKTMFLNLGDGRHYGEWAGLGIQKNPLNLDAKYFYLFNTRRWGTHNPPPDGIKVVPKLYEGIYSGSIIDETMEKLWQHGLENNVKHEGVVVYLPKLDAMEKYTFEYSKGKWRGEK